ncbi:MAG: hypothetical protein K0U47_10040 [Epsilonproteobacteria bacterium]|nr:hypothetical protein [Campylobacterota bacterium]
MRIFQKIAERLREYKKSFFTINQTELTRFSKFLMILFFLTALWLIAMGIQSSISQTTKPGEKYGYQCEKFAKAKKLNIFDFQKPKRVLRYDHRYESFGVAQECQTLKKSYRAILDNHHIQSEIDQIHILEQNLQASKMKQQRLNQEYTNMLLEKISEQDSENSILHSDADIVKSEVDALSKKEHNLKTLIAQKSDPLNYPAIQAFQLLIDKSGKSIVTQLEKERKFYRFKISMQVFAFLIPIWLLFYWLYRVLGKREKYIFAQLAFYVASAAALYGLVELIQLIYSIIPKVFLAKLIAFFTSYNMVIVLNILGVLFFLVLFGVIIHKIQKNHEKNRAKKDTKVLNVKNEKCFNCGSRRSERDNYCAFCAEKLKTECKACGKEIYRYTLYCTACGEKQDI